MYCAQMLKGGASAHAVIVKDNIVIHNNNPQAENLRCNSLRFFVYIKVELCRTKV